VQCSGINGLEIKVVLTEPWSLVGISGDGFLYAEISAVLPLRLNHESGLLFRRMCLVAAHHLRNSRRIPPIELFFNIFSAQQPKGIFFCIRIAFFPPYTGRSIMTVRHYERHKVHQVRFT
jgi:hypothetical protein